MGCQSIAKVTGKKRCRLKTVNYERYNPLDFWDAQKRASILKYNVHDKITQDAKLHCKTFCEGKNCNKINFVSSHDLQNYGKSKVCIRASRPIRPVLNPSFCHMKRLEILVLPPGWDASPSQKLPTPHP